MSVLDPMHMIWRVRMLLVHKFPLQLQKDSRDIELLKITFDKIHVDKVGIASRSWHILEILVTKIVIKSLRKFLLTSVRWQLSSVLMQQILNKFENFLLALTLQYLVFMIFQFLASLIILFTTRCCHLTSCLSISCLELYHRRSLSQKSLKMRAIFLW